jgi:cobalt-zinc-cadmium resistance protein CzcA
MFNSILRASIRHRHAVLTVTLLLALFSVFSYKRLIIDAVPDITNIQVQINTHAPGYSPFETERRITQPLELMLAGLPSLEYTRSLSRYGLSQVTVVFKDKTDIYFARQLVSQRIQESKERLPPGINPSMGPIATGLGEIFMFTVENDPDSTKQHSLQELREIQDWVVRPQLRTVPGVVEINSIGGAAKQVVVTPDIDRLRAYTLTLSDLSLAIGQNNSNVGAGFVEQNGEQFLVRVPSQVEDPSELLEIVVGVHEGTPIYLRDVAKVEVGSELRTGAATQNGREVVLGTVFMLMGENGRTVSELVSAKIEEISRSVPEGVLVRPVYNRSNLVNATIATVRKNLFEGALFVVVVLFLALGNIRAALITALVIPLSMGVTILGMVQGKLSANLMSLGALDFGLIVDGAVILVENCIKRLSLAQARAGRLLSKEERLELVYEASSEVRQATMFGELIIMIVYVPILALSGIEGKMFHPMALTVLLALGAAFVLSLTFVPAAVAVFITGRVREHGKVITQIQSSYEALLKRILRYPRAVLLATVSFFLSSLLLFGRLGAEFIPSLDEGDIALHAMRIPGTSLSQSIAMQHQLETAIKKVPEVKEALAKIGTAEIATDPMPPSIADGYVILKPRKEWKDPSKPKDEVVAELERLLREVPGNNYEFTQPIQMRFNELIAGVRSDLAVKIFGDDTDVLTEQGRQIEALIRGIPGASDVKLEQTTGLPMISIDPNRAKLGRFGINAGDVQDLVRTAYAGETVSTFFEGDRNFPIVVRLGETDRHDIEALSELPILVPNPNMPKASLESERTAFKYETPEKPYLTLADVADISIVEGPNQISRENGKRRVVVTANVRGRDLGSFVEEVQSKLTSRLELPDGYWIGLGGQYEHLISARTRLMIVVPMVLAGVFALIFVTFRSVRYSLLVFSGVPFALSGGIIALWLRGIPFSISAAVGFIALSGVSVLNGLVLVSFTKKLLEEGHDSGKAIIEAAVARVRPVLMTALVASLGFVPMALSHGTGSEVQRPLASVVIGGIISSTALTLLVLPVLLQMFGRDGRRSSEK